MAKKGALAVVCSDDKWQAEADLNTLIAAEEIREDPKRLAAAKQCAKDKLVDMAKITAMNVVPEPGDKDKGDKA